MLKLKVEEFTENLREKGKLKEKSLERDEVLCKKELIINMCYYRNSTT